MRVCLDRFSQGLPDPAEAKIVRQCDGCSGEIYNNDQVYLTIDGLITHADMNCLKMAYQVVLLDADDILEERKCVR